MLSEHSETLGLPVDTSASRGCAEDADHPVLQLNQLEMTRQLCEPRIHPPIHCYTVDTLFYDTLRYTVGVEVLADLSTHWRTEDVSHEAHSQLQVKEQPG